MTDRQGVSVQFPTWQVNEAVRKSLMMPPPSRLIMLTLSDLAASDTAEIPEHRTPSLAQLAGYTGLGLATVKRHLDLLEAEGWLERVRPTDAERVRRVRTRYRLLIPQGSERAVSTAQREPRQGSDGAQSQGSERAGKPKTRLSVSPDRAQSELPQGSERATDTAHSGPSYDALRDGNDGSNAKTQPPRTRGDAKHETTPDAEPDPETEARDKLAREVAAWWWDQLTIKPAGKRAWHASLRVISNLLAVGHEPKAVAAAARTIGAPLTTARMEIELGRMRLAAAPAAGHTPRRSTVDERMAQTDEAVAALKARHAEQRAALPPGAPQRQLDLAALMPEVPR